MTLTCYWSTPDGATARVSIVGELQFPTADRLLRLVSDKLAGQAGVREVRLDCGELAFCDSSGLSTLLLVHRAVADAGARLHLDNRRPALDKLLALTGTMTYLTGETPASRARLDS
ncbi:STAS domain-containing protein [Amycolatopsis sp. OK19-0408]|uniref:STAS domain-containing protein n=1 Tax=Amycolatopsis iheyensis TaxID=2945988 RepID=A0A9X2SHL9_9PSEU|nr:STAS domain-containing protein [Amycolatopsis iheyensis]MCR6481973.1 STAS domain-containing protein [Amycolatopsis iheyensis]